MNHKKISKRHQPRGFEILFEDDDIIVGNKSAGLLTIGANYDRENTANNLVNNYVRKGNSRSRKFVYCVHRLDRETSGLLIFAKHEHAKDRLKKNWRNVEKTYYAVVFGHLTKKKIPSQVISKRMKIMWSIQRKTQGKVACPIRSMR
ncbi:MAG TPA: pseudouridine synthase, partial [Victivallales bacterium]|nr:pseudouridine synthase [Victivallales bacterium]